MQIPLTDSDLTGNSKQPQSIKRNSSTIESGNDAEVTNAINSPVFDIHPGDFAIPKREDKIFDAALALIDSKQVIR